MAVPSSLRQRRRTRRFPNPPRRTDCCRLPVRNGKRSHPTAAGETNSRAFHMDVFEAVESRLSCRAFLDRPVDPVLVRDLIALASRAASGGNLQPWRVYALTGAPL